MRLLARAGLLTLCWLPLTVGAARPFVPIQPSPLAESWRWHAQEALDGMSLTDCLVGDDGSIWFVSQSGLVLYDGGEPELFPAPKGLSLIAYRTGAITSKGVIYMLLPGQILEFKGGNYRVIFSFEGRYDMLRGRAVLTADDTVLFGTPEGIVAVRDGTVRVVAPDNRRASFLLLDSRGDLWTNQVGTGVVFRCKAFSHENGTAVNGWESFQVIPGGGAHLSLVELPDGSIWCANDSPHFGIQAFDPASGSWMPVPIDADGEEKVHLGVDVTPDGTVMIYGDKRILLQKDGEIEQLTLKDFNFPITSPFVRSLKSGSMIIGGRRERVYLVDCSTKWWETFKGINYFCSDTAGRQWFISFSGEIICRDITSGE
ncbi:MAG TPA: hypothetical protein VK995_02115, partial [Oceanipulchritudo sp.]|nr:hypothetical protein [Oceanipulchritudo sp.]